MRVILLGFGKIGLTILDMLRMNPQFTITVGDTRQNALEVAQKKGASTALVDVTSPDSLRAACAGHDILINALPHQLNIPVANIAAELGLNYFDLSEDVATTRHIKDLARSSRNAFMPQCGLAPGFIAIAAADLAAKFEKLRSVMCRVGALPIYPTNALKYNLTWSTDGLINEYCMPCEAIHEGKLREVLPLEGLESFSLDGVEYECFNTSGGVGTLCETLEGKVETLNYKTVRYPGHCAIAKVLINELGFSQRREILKDVLEANVPMTLQDEVLVMVSVQGWQGKYLMQENFVCKIYGRELAGELRSAIQITTAAGMCGVVELFSQGKLPQSGFIRQEQVKLADFLATTYGQFYAEASAGRKSA